MWPRFINTLFIMLFLYSLSFGPYMLLRSFFQSHLPQSVSRISELVLFPHLLIAYYSKAYWSYGEWCFRLGSRNRECDYWGFRQYMQSEYLEKMGFEFNYNEKAP